MAYNLLVLHGYNSHCNHFLEFKDYYIKTYSTHLHNVQYKVTLPYSKR